MTTTTHTSDTQPRHIFTVPVLLHIEASSPQDALDKVVAAFNDDNPGDVVISTDDGAKVTTFVWANVPDSIEDGYTGTEHAYEIPAGGFR
jgi:hypothetical protein